MPAEIQIASDNAALCRMAAEEFARAAASAIAATRRFSVALSGGTTPRGVYAVLAGQYKDLPWEKIHIFFGDERNVPPDNPESNYHMAHEALLSQVAIPATNVHRFRTELGPEAAATDYEDQLRDFFGLSAGQLSTGEWPRFDLLFLGLGDDGHTASLFPGTAALAESSRMAVANWVEKLHTFRLTLTFPVLNHAAEVCFLVSGAGKAETLQKVFSPPGPEPFPSQRVHPENGRLLWLLDQDAARLLPK